MAEKTFKEQNTIRNSSIFRKKYIQHNLNKVTNSLFFTGEELKPVLNETP